MKDFVEYIAKRLVDDPAAVHIDQIDSDKTSIFELSVAPDDVGKVIGRSGKTVNAIRTLLTAVSVKKAGKRSMLEVND